MQKQNLTQKFIPVTASILAPAYLIATCVGSYAEVPKTARITQPATFSSSMTIHSKKQDPLKASANSTMNWENSLWVPNDGSGARATLRFYNSGGRDMGTKIDAIPQKGLTKYMMPCKALVSGGSDFTVTWENGQGRACDKGLKVTSKDFDKFTQGSPQIIFLAQKDKSILKVNLDTSRWNPKALSMAQVDDADIRYYCSALPASGGGSAGMAAGFNSVEEACNQATQKCLKNNSGSDCLIETMGEWSINDPELMTSVTCKNGKSSLKRVRGSEINDPGSSNNTILQDLLEQLFGQAGGFLSSILGLKPKACVLDVYHPDEIIISPVNSQQAVVQVKDVENGRVQVDVREGQALLRSTQSPTGIVANQGESYFFDEEGAINKGTTPTPSPTPTPSLYPAPR